MKTLNKLAQEIYQNAVEKGWYKNGLDTKDVNRLLMACTLVHSEIPLKN